MTDEVLLIVLAGAWLFVHVCAHGLTQWGVAGNAWAFGARDDPPRETLLSGRLWRAFTNYLETLPAALAVLIAAELSGRANELTSYGGWIWFCSRVAYLPLAEVDRAVADGRTDGFIAVVAGPRRWLRNVGGGRILGATIVAPRAGEMISEVVLAMRTRAFAGRLAQVSHAYPTWSNGVQKAAAQFFGEIEGRRARRVE